MFSVLAWNKVCQEYQKGNAQGEWFVVTSFSGDIYSKYYNLIITSDCDIFCLFN